MTSVVAISFFLGAGLNVVIPDVALLMKLANPGGADQEWHGREVKKAVFRSKSRRIIKEMCAKFVFLVRF